MEFNYYTILIGMICGAFLFYKCCKLTVSTKVQENKNISISVIIPARNEGHNLPNLLEDLKTQTFKVHEIICVDDASEDNTPGVIKEFDVLGIRINELPSGWKGKPWACQKGADYATGDTLLFIDSDVRLSDTAIESLVKRYTENSKVISVQPYHTVKKHYEYFSLFFNLIEICSTAMCLSSYKRTFGFFGPVLMISKDLFDKNEGYNVVKNNVIEDFTLGNYYNKKGIKIDLYNGAEEISFRMYPNSFASLFEAWSRNFSSGSLSTKPWLLLMIIAWVGNLTAIPIELVQSIMNQNAITFMVFLLIYIANSLFIYRTAKVIGSYPYYICLIYPIYLLAFHIIFLCSVLNTYVFKSTTWKGRNL